MFLKRTKYNKINDNELIILYQNTKDKRIIGELYKRYGHLVFGLCLKLLKNQQEAEDKVMLIFEHLYEKLLKHEISNFKSWLYRVSQNECYMQLRKRDNTTLSYEEVAFENENKDDEELEKVIAKEKIVLELEQAIGLLKPDQQIAIQLFYIEEHSYQYISERLKWDLNKVKSQIQNAKRNLKLILEKIHENQSSI